MAAKKIPAEVEALTIRGQQLLSPEALIANLKSLDNLLVKDTMKQREEIHKLHSNLLSLSADNDILDAIQRDVFRLILSFSLFDATARIAAEKEGIYRDLKLVVEELVEEVKEMKSQKNVDVQILKAENKANASKISALNEKCRFLEENSGQLKKKVRRMAVGKNLVDQRNADYVIQISSLQAEILELQSARKSVEDAHCSCVQDIAAVQREKNLKGMEAEDLKMQLKNCMKAKRIVEQKLEAQIKSMTW